MQRPIPTALALAALLAACAPTAPPAAAPLPEDAPYVATDTATRPAVRPIELPADFRAAVERGTRTLTGEPGPNYWQNRVRYDIRAELDPATQTLRGTERVVLYNRSPAELDRVVLNLYQNVFSEGVPRNRTVTVTGGVTLESVAAQGRALGEIGFAEARQGAAGYRVAGTLGVVHLPRAVPPGDSVALEIAWNHRVPPAGSFRTAWEDALGGRVFQVAQWYPQVATFDDLEGWDATPYLGDGEFYLEYGDFDVALTLPDGWIVGGTGTLENAEQILAPGVLDRYRAALAGEETVRVVREEDLGAGRALRASGGRVTWRLSAEDVRDFGWATSDRYLWDVRPAEIRGEDGARTIPVHALYRPGAPGWEQAARYGEHSVEFFSALLLPYPYPQVTVSEGPIYGMEYPQLVFIARPQDPAALYSVIAHEVGHEWFPMLVGSDEASYAWMDEGLTTWNEDLAVADFYPGDDPFERTRASYLRVAGTEAEVPLMRHTDLVSPYGARTIAAYSKPGTLMRSLRAVVGDDVFERAMRTYAAEWSFRHPTPWDFFHTFERVSGRDLDWFFAPWWFETVVLDQAVEDVRPVEGGVEVTVRDLGGAPAPTVVAVTTASGSTTRVTVPVEQWLGERTRTAVVTVPVGGEVARVQLDPDGLFPDVDRDNDVWTAP